MSKIGRKPIPVSKANIAVSGSQVTIKGPLAQFVHELPERLELVLVDGFARVNLIGEHDKPGKMIWGLHRALLANKIKGAETGFEKKLTIVGLGYKAILAGTKMTFSLGYTHKIDYELPEGVKVEIDRTGQQLLFKCADKFILGNVCDAVRSFRPPEPYKGTGIIREGEVILRKAGKTK